MPAGGRQARTVTVVARHGQPQAALIHDLALDQDGCPSGL